MMVSVSTRIPQNSPVLALLQARLVFARQSQPVRRMPAIIPVNLCQSFPASSFLWKCPCLFSRLRAPSSLETCFHMMYRMAARRTWGCTLWGTGRGSFSPAAGAGPEWIFKQIQGLGFKSPDVCAANYLPKSLNLARRVSFDLSSYLHCLIF